jgi:hypothetical protein
MPDLLIRIKKKNDGSAALSCTRPDHSVTWQRQDGQLGAFFPFHDLTHYAVETTLGFREAFYGLLADGWNLTDFGQRAVNLMPGDALLAELIVGYFDLERATGLLDGAVEMNEKIRSYFADKRLPVPSFRITDEQIVQIRARRAELFAQWKTVPEGEAIELAFDRPAGAAA